MTGAQPLDLVVMVYDGALTSCRQALEAMETKDLQLQHKHLIRAQQFVSELAASLDMQKGGEMAQNLFGLYAYCLNSLSTANVTDNPKLVEDSVKVLSELRDAWQQIREGESRARAA